MKITSLQEAFDDRSFSVREAAVALGTDPATAGATLRRLKVHGEIERAGRGRYRLAVPERRLAVVRRQRKLVRRHILGAPLRIALDGPDAVASWTGGRYQVGQVPGHEILYLAIDTAEWRAFLALLDAEGIPYGTHAVWPRGDGLKVIVRPVAGLRRVWRDGEPVLERAFVEQIIAADRVAYEGAEEWLETAAD